MRKTTVAIVLVGVALLLLAGIAVRAGGGGRVSKWIASFHGNASQ
jgi:hypothetical protein